MLDKKQPDIAVIAEHLRPVLQRLNRDKVPTKLTIEKEAGIIKIYSRDCNIITKASAGLLDILELSCSTAEHHPYATTLYHIAEILKSILDGWTLTLVKNRLVKYFGGLPKLKHRLID